MSSRGPKSVFSGQEIVGLDEHRSPAKYTLSNDYGRIEGLRKSDLKSRHESPTGKALNTTRTDKSNPMLMNETPRSTN